MSNPQVLHIISSSGLYGAERVLLNQLSVDTGVEAAVLCLGVESGNKNPFVAALTKLNIDVILEKGKGGTADAYRALRHAICTLRPDVIHCHGYKETILGCIAGLLFQKRVIVTQHGFTNRTRKIKWYNQLATWCCRLFAVEKIICVSDSILKYYQDQKIDPQRLLLLPNAIHLPSSEPERVKGDVFSFERGENELLIGFIGRLSSEKGPDRFLEMISKLSKETARFKAIVVGGGPLIRELEAWVTKAGLSEKIVFCGFREDVEDIIRCLDILVMPSRTEGTPMVLLEAMALRVSVAAFSVGGIPAVVQHGQNGMLAPDGDIDMLASHVMSLMNDAGLRDRLGESASQCIAEHYNICRQGSLLASLYRKEGAYAG
ncbi:glycosyltransferase family 4 protein [Alkalimarinus coralli]|uniref:glycosyltransferase family 4 protein n=1 Tax=Alkalimarinus coralli TaxID=2935863 RepID=UPI00202B526A|nr:glycosyltransferase family 4 protein [Alkalimarinus coralli]